MEFENVTLRSKSKSRCHDVSNLSTNNSLFETTLQSLPYTSIDGTNSCCEILNDRITELDVKLLTANNKIDNLIEENENLKSELKKCYDMIRKQEQQPLKNKRTNDEESTLNINTSLSNTAVRKTKTSKKQKSNSNRMALPATSSPKQPRQSTTAACRGSTAHEVNDKICTQYIQNTVTCLSHLSGRIEVKSSEIKQRNKICIISENRKNKIRSIAENILNRNSEYEICHYLKPNCGINNMICDLEDKLKEFTMCDYCVILIGATDFERTKNYNSLVENIRKKIKRITHTNIIICAPTYKLSYFSSMYNCRVEIFNDLLCTDIKSHEYAYFVDSNKNLSCDYDMFSHTTRSVNNYGMKTIFRDIAKYIISTDVTTELEQLQTTELNQQNKTQFFLE